MTLVELLVVLVLLGLVAGVAGVAFHLPRDGYASLSVAATRIAHARAEALTTGRPVTVTLDPTGSAASATAFSDGSVIAEGVASPGATTDSSTTPYVDRLTGRPPHAAR